MKQDFQKGEVINVDLGTPTKEVIGHEQGFNTPCIVIKSFPHLELVVVIPCTSKELNVSSYTTVRILKGSGGLTLDSYALCHQIRTISFKRIIGRLGNLNAKDFLKVQSVLHDILEI
jgi:mRNA interferase MazF